MKKEMGRRIVPYFVSDTKYYITSCDMYEFMGLRLYLYKDGRLWIVRELTTGMVVSWGHTKKEAVYDAEMQLDTDAGRQFIFDVKAHIKYKKIQDKTAKFIVDNRLDVD